MSSPFQLSPTLIRRGKGKKKKKKNQTYKREMSNRVEEGEKKARRQRKYGTASGDRESIKHMCERKGGN
jgi:hypothetical protein